MEGFGERLIQLTDAEGQLLNLSVFFIFGILVIGVVQPLSWEIALYALLSLTLIRMLPVAISLIRTHLRSVSVLFMGWFGPRGLASIVLGLIVVAEAPLLAGREQIEQVVALTVLLSVLLHGLTAAPLSATYARQAQKMGPDAPEKQRAVECRPAWAPHRPVFSEMDEAGCGIHMERDRDMSKEEITQTEPQTQPQAEPPIVSTGPGAAMPSQEWVGTRPDLASGAHGRRRPTHRGGGAGRFLPALAGTHFHRMVRHRPLSGGGAQPCGQLAPAAPQDDQAPPGHRLTYLGLVVALLFVVGIFLPLLVDQLNGLTKFVSSAAQAPEGPTEYIKGLAKQNGLGGVFERFSDQLKTRKRIGSVGQKPLCVHRRNSR